MTTQPGRVVRWAPRVPRRKVRRLYESAAQGLLDSELLYARHGPEERE